MSNKLIGDVALRHVYKTMLLLFFYDYLTVVLLQLILFLSLPSSVTLSFLSVFFVSSGVFPPKFDIAFPRQKGRTKLHSGTSLNGAVVLFRLFFNDILCCDACPWQEPRPGEGGWFGPGFGFSGANHYGCIWRGRHFQKQYMFCWDILKKNHSPRRNGS